MGPTISERTIAWEDSSSKPLIETNEGKPCMWKENATWAKQLECGIPGLARKIPFPHVTWKTLPVIRGRNVLRIAIDVFRYLIGDDSLWKLSSWLQLLSR